MCIVHTYHSTADFRRRGIAKRLCRAAEASARGWGYSEVLLKVEAGNRKAHLYTCICGCMYMCVLCVCVCIAGGVLRTLNRQQARATGYSLLTTHRYELLTTHHSPLTTHYSPLTTGGGALQRAAAARLLDRRHRGAGSRVRHRTHLLCAARTTHRSSPGSALPLPSLATLTLRVPELARSQIWSASTTKPTPTGQATTTGSTAGACAIRTSLAHYWTCLQPTTYVVVLTTYFH